MTDTTTRRSTPTAAMVRALHRFFAAQLHLINAPVARLSNTWIHDRTLTALHRGAWILSCSRLPSAGAVLTFAALDYLARRGDDDMVPDVRRLAAEQRQRDELHAIAIAFRNAHGEAASTTYSEAFAAQRAIDAATAAEATSAPCPFTFAYGAPCRLPAGHHLAHLPVRDARDDARYRRHVEQLVSAEPLVPSTNYLDAGDDHDVTAAELAAEEGESEYRYELALDALDRLDDVLQLLAGAGRRLIDDTDVFTAEYVSVMTARRQLVTAVAPELDAHDVLNHAAGTYVSTRAAVEALRFGRVDEVVRESDAAVRDVVEGLPHDDGPPHLDACKADGELTLCADGCPRFDAVASAALAGYAADVRWTYTGTPGLFRLGDERAPQVFARAVPDRPGRFTISILGRDVDDVERAPDGEWRPVGGGTEGADR